jgi:hypothetical protein
VPNPQNILGTVVRCAQYNASDALLRHVGDNVRILATVDIIDKIYFERNLRIGQFLTDMVFLGRVRRD